MWRGDRVCNGIKLGWTVKKQAGDSDEQDFC